MNSLLQAYLSPGYWRHGFSIAKLVTSILAAFGTLWLLTELLVFFEFSPTGISWLKSNWLAFLLAALIWALYVNRPRHSVSKMLRDRGIRIEVRIADLFSGNQSLIISSNTSFDTDMSGGIISERSTQGQFAKRYYSNIFHLDADIDAYLKSAHVPAPSKREGKVGKPFEYPIGTTVTLRSGGKTAYLCAIARMNNQGNASATFEDIKNALPSLWDHIISRGDHGDIAMPILGAGLARVGASHEDLIYEILNSFIAACASYRVCDSLTVVISPKNYYQSEINIENIGRFLEHICRHTKFVSASDKAQGVPIITFSELETTKG